MIKILVTDGMDKGAVQILKDMGHEVTEQFFEPELRSDVLIYKLVE